MQRTKTRIAALIERHLSKGDRARSQFKESGSALDQAIALGAPKNEPIEITLRSGKARTKRRVVIRDQFAEKNTAFSAKVFQRYAVEDWKEPGSARVSRAGEAVSGSQASKPTSANSAVKEAP